VADGICGEGGTKENFIADDRAVSVSVSVFGRAGN
jgi:hypothetical protein